LSAAAGLAAFLLVGVNAQQGRKDNWVSTWATAPVARAIATAAPAAAAPVVAPPAASTTAPVAPAASAAAQAAPPVAGAAAGRGNGRGTGGTPPAGAGGAGRGAAALVAPNNQTLRQIVHVSLGGDRLRVVFANSFGTRPLTIGAAHVALRGQDAAIVPESGRPLTFSGERTIAIPPGATMISDPVSLAVPNLSDLAIDLYLPDDTSASPLTRHGGAYQTNYLAAGNLAGAADLPGATVVRSWYFVSRVEVTAPERTPVIVATGDSITDGTATTVDSNGRWPDVLARRLLAQRGRKIAVVNAGIAANRVLSDAVGDGGVGILARLDRDVLVQTGATHMIFMLGINDIGQARQNPSPTAADLIAGHRQVIARAHALGIKIFGATLTPFEGAAYYTPEGEAKRQALNQWIRTGKEYDGVVDFDAALRDPKQPTKFLQQYQSGDQLHPNNAGYEVMGNAIDLALFK
jgi:lysophospholipase L1-like esterase